MQQNNGLQQDPQKSRKMLFHEFMREIGNIAIHLNGTADMIVSNCNETFTAYIPNLGWFGPNVDGRAVINQAAAETKKKTIARIPGDDCPSGRALDGSREPVRACNPLSTPTSTDAP